MPGIYPYGSVAYGAAPLASGDPIEVFQVRLVAEAIAEWNAIHTVSTRLVTEVIAAALPDGPPDTSFTISELRLVVEAIGNASAYLTSHTHVGRIALEVIASTDASAKGFLTFVQVTRPSIALVLDPSDWSAGGQFLLHSDGSPRLRVYGSSGTTNVILTDGANSLSTSFSTPTGPYVLLVRAGLTPSLGSIWLNGSAQSVSFTGSGWNTTIINEFGGQAPASYPKSGQLAEMMLWDRLLNTAEATYISSYLRCRWILPGCNPYSDIGPPP